mgnify:CR=1 FL=1
MEHVGLLADLGWMMVAGAIAAIVFQRLKLPEIVADRLVEI